MDVSRYVDTVELKFEVEFITPCFLGGADGNAEIRTAPFKHGIRYWWRILYGAKYADRIKETEDLIFGSTERLSNVSISISNIHDSIFTEKIGFPKGKRVSVSHNGREMKINILDYLAYGKYDYVKGNGNVYNSSYIKPQTKLLLNIRINNIGHTDELKDAIKMFIMYGGIGSRSRNGFGSMSADLSNISFSKNVIFSEKPLTFPVVSSKSKFFRTSPFNTWEDALSEIGEIYKNARNSLEKQHNYEKRGLISRPIIVKNERIPDNITNDRIPKPFYLGIMKYEKQYIGYILCLPIDFYEKSNKQEYLVQVDRMTNFFTKQMKDGSEGFFKQFKGGNSK